MRRLAAFGLFCVLATQSSAQQTPSPEGVIRINVNLVQVDAIVTDAKGKPVTNLTADDFKVFQDGKAQTITDFSFVDVRDSRVNTPPPPTVLKSQQAKNQPAPVPPPPLPPIRSDQIRRTIALMVDDLALSADGTIRVRQTLKKWVDTEMRPGDLVAVLGLGGLGHRGVQYAVKMGFKTVAIARGKDKEPLAKKLGAWRYLDSQTQDPAAELQKLGGAKTVLATVTNGDAMSTVVGGLGVNGVFIVIGAAQSMQVSPLQLLSGRRSVKGWYSGTAMDSQDTLAFSVLSGVRSMNEVYPLEKVAEAYERMMSGKARFRVVLTTGQ